MPDLAEAAKALISSTNDYSNGPYIDFMHALDKVIGPTPGGDVAYEYRLLGLLAELLGSGAITQTQVQLAAIKTTPT